MAEAIAVPEELVRLSGLDPHYQSAYATDTAVQLTPLEWGHRAFDEASPVLGAWLRVLFAVLSGRRPWASAPARDPGWLLPGWQVLQNDEVAIVLGFEDPTGYTMRVIISTRPGQVVVATLVRYTSRRGRVVWRFTSRLHEATVRRVVRNAVRLGGET